MSPFSSDIRHARAVRKCSSAISAPALCAIWLPILSNFTSAPDLPNPTGDPEIDPAQQPEIDPALKNRAPGSPPPDLADLFAALVDVQAAPLARALAAEVESGGVLEGPAPAKKALRNANPNHDGLGRFASGAPRRITTTEADQRLTRGTHVTSSTGKEVHFGPRLKLKLESDPDYEARKELLDFGIDAVRNGQCVTETTDGDVRDIYFKQYDFAGTQRGLITLVSARDGEVFNIRYITRNQAKAKGFLNRSSGSPLGYGPDEQPSATVIRAIVAADGTTDWLLSLPTVGGSQSQPQKQERPTSP